MICIPLSAPTNTEMLRLIAAAAAEPAALYELRLDSLHEAPQVEELIAACARPVIATCRSLEEGGGHREGALRRRDILRRAAEGGAAMIDAEAGDLHCLERYTNVTRIVSLHDFRETPVDLPARVAALCAASADWVKFAVAATAPLDNIRVFETLAQCPKPAIGIAMGAMGLVSRILGGRFGSRITFGSMGAGLESAPGQPTAQTLAEIYRVDAITDKTAVYGVRVSEHGDEHIRYNRIFSQVNLDAVCIPLPATGDKAFLEVLVHVGTHRRSAALWNAGENPFRTVNVEKT